MFRLRSVAAVLGLGGRVLGFRAGVFWLGQACFGLRSGHDLARAGLFLLGRAGFGLQSGRVLASNWA